MKPSRTRFSTSSSLHTSRLRAWQAKSESDWMLTNSQRRESLAACLAPWNPPRPRVDEGVGRSEHVLEGGEVAASVSPRVDVGVDAGGGIRGGIHGGIRAARADLACAALAGGRGGRPIDGLPRVEGEIGAEVGGGGIAGARSGSGARGDVHRPVPGGREGRKPGPAAPPPASSSSAQAGT